MRIVLTLLLITSACGNKKVKAVDYQNAPRLPSPVAGTYARVPAQPPDAVIAGLVKGHTWDASLGGAAAGLALAAVSGKKAGLERWEVREAAWRAGYPYPIDTIKGWSTKQAEEPAPLRDWLTKVESSDDLGLVRARGDDGEAWVALVSKPRASIGVQPRQVEVGGAVNLPSIAGAQYFVCDPDGNVVGGALEIPQQFTLDIDGEWIFSVVDKKGPIALFPVYVAMMPPEVGLFEPGQQVHTGDEALARVAAVLTDLRGAYGLKPWLRDAFLDQAAQGMLSNPEKTAKSVANTLGYAPDATWKWECRGRSVEACLDQILWDPRARPALLTDSEFLGLGAEVMRGGVHVVALIARD